jgi:hypothetical protein
MRYELGGRIAFDPSAFTTITFTCAFPMVSEGMRKLKVKAV